MSNAVESFVDARIDRSSRTFTLAAGDVFFIALFVGLGQARHGADSFSAPLATVETLVPFLVGWFVAAIALGAYAADALESVPKAVRVTASAWIVGALIGQALRATPVFEGSAAPAFVLVSLVVGLVLLVPWRALLAYQNEG